MKQVVFTTVALCAMHAVSAQNVGIGVANPVRAKLEVSGLPGTTAAIFGLGSGISLQSAWPTIGFNQYRNAATGYGRYIHGGYAATQTLDPASGIMALDMIAPGNIDEPITTVPNRAWVINALGNIGLGNTISNATLTVSKKTGVNATAIFTGTINNSIFNFGTNEDTYIRAGKDNGTVYINDIPGGKTILKGLVGVNTTSSNFPLQVRAGGLGVMKLENEDASHSWYFSFKPASGELVLHYDLAVAGMFNVNGVYSALSDRRVKKNIRPLPPVLDNVMKLRPTEYEMARDSNGIKNIGLIAQEVKEIFPELVSVIPAKSKEDINNLQTLNYSGFGIIAIKAIQEQQQIIQQQDKKLKELETLLKEVRSKINL